MNIRYLIPQLINNVRRHIVTRKIHKACECVNCQQTFANMDKIVDDMVAVTWYSQDDFLDCTTSVLAAASLADYMDEHDDTLDGRERASLYITLYVMIEKLSKEPTSSKDDYLITEARGVMDGFRVVL